MLYFNVRIGSLLDSLMPVPFIQFTSHKVIDRIKQMYRSLSHEPSLWTCKQAIPENWRLVLTKSISMVFWRPLSAKLLMYIRCALFRASAIAPASDIFPDLVKEDLSAPVPAYIFESA